MVEANVAYPAKGVAKLARLTAQIKAAGLATRTTFRDRTRSVRRRAHAIGAWLRRRSDEAKEEVKAINGEMAGIALAAVGDARAVARNASSPESVVGWVAELDGVIEHDPVDVVVAGAGSVPRRRQPLW